MIGLLLAAALALTAGMPAAAQTHPPACAASALKVTAGSPGAAAGSAYYPLRFRNVTGAACTLHGYPGVSLVRNSGRRIGRAARRDRAYPPSPVYLAPGKSGHATLQVTDALNYPPRSCRPVTAHHLKVYPPGSLTAVVIPFRVLACTVRVPGGQLGIDALRRHARLP